MKEGQRTNKRIYESIIWIYLQALAKVKSALHQTFVVMILVSHTPHMHLCIFCNKAKTGAVHWRA